MGSFGKGVLMVELDPALMQAHAPRMAPSIKPYRQRIWRVTEVELESLSWLVDRFRATGYPDLNPGGLNGMMRAAIHDRQCLLARTDDTVGLYRAEQTPLEPRFMVNEVWARMRSPFKRSRTESEACQAQLNEMRLYAMAWARGIKARRFSCDTDSDMPFDSGAVLPKIVSHLDYLIRKRNIVVDLDTLPP